jgi:hypothetical protein
MRRIFTIIDGVYGETRSKGEENIVYDPTTEEGFNSIAEAFGEEEAMIALMRVTLNDAKHMMFALLEDRKEFTPGQVLSVIRDIDKILHKERVRHVK